MSVRIGTIAIGGRGDRFGQGCLQKCLVPIEGKPIVEYTIDAFLDSGIKLVIFLTGFMHEKISAYLIQRYGTHAKFVPANIFGGTMGIASAIYTLRHFVNEDFLFAHGDSILNHSVVNNFVKRAESLANNIAVMLVSKDISVAPTHVFLRTETDKSTIRTVRLTTPERRPSKNDLVETGLCYFRPSIFDFIGKVKPYQQTASFIRLAKKAGHTASVVITTKPWFCLHTPDDLQRWELIKTSLLPIT